MSADAIPVLDFSGYQADPDSRRQFLEELRRAARDVGFFYLSGHGVPQSLIDDVLGASRRFRFAGRGQLRQTRKLAHQCASLIGIGPMAALRLSDVQASITRVR
ncbi:2-oxoglutarate and iron-dependent oxygenase domain-containing protein [Mesorhizobium sp. VK24D]|uniref:2-oxoglutarate and iron-dependent oxygenase domain-containing protein n=1 Tax=Mesorhizobium album TaxID=3072314 RepID=A0ABU4Y4T3_9HYPH|nr:2-oxoglutarate and iron-dependent oxygenase domain-containing protein [Mesorhizobium sp. VK24D]MDX8481950.1 2-oxoglutarate and iron-dependent oxygenase domain-containing protein [Mesorhizobium sp. VK24D]